MVSLSYHSSKRKNHLHLTCSFVRSPGEILCPVTKLPLQLLQLHRAYWNKSRNVPTYKVRKILSTFSFWKACLPACLKVPTWADIDRHNNKRMSVRSFIRSNAMLGVSNMELFRANRRTIERTNDTGNIGDKSLFPCASSSISLLLSWNRWAVHSKNALWKIWRFSDVPIVDEIDVWRRMWLSLRGPGFESR